MERAEEEQGSDFHVFISHAGPNKPFAQELRRDLLRLGLRAFVDKDDLERGDQADTKMLWEVDRAPVGI